MSKTFDRYASLLFLVLGAAFLIGSQNISASAYGSNVGPNIFPLGLGALLVLLSLRLFYETFKYKQEEKKQGPALDYKRFLIILVAALLYVLLLEEIGYVASTFLFLLVGFQTMSKGKWLSTLLISGAFSFGIYFLYVNVLDGSLPGLPAWLGF
ncbi:tripartite tricarboxylate transporter TctB family protein [Brevibacillus nitrificans]|uniref:tripartite tricarboxylate transporter TctB family protein n=1 Tax=Brevibacillus nitrificans TaxID=651560 RepID=UPI0028670810|nr:tripartite tricarboxylate transporter TctB family protein [Brevibacillus nitrificans]MDR7317244.1 putative tricarboxylic transport membrane protein [Brevibacillus nitrificans]